MCSSCLPDPGFVVEPYPGREGESGDKVQVTLSNDGNPYRRPPKVEGYECFFVSYFGNEGVTKFSYRRI